jgi:hypothetical protein
VNGKSVDLPDTGASLASVDAVAQATVQFNQANPAVFDNSLNNGACGVAYKDFMCALLFPKCGAAVTNQVCISGGVVDRVLTVVVPRRHAHLDVCAR